MKFARASRGQITRRRLRLQAGQVLELDEGAMRAVVGCARGRLEKTSDEWLDETRGLVGELVR